jgi:hypothetical protein
MAEVAPTPKLLEAVVRVAREDVRINRKIGEGAFGEVSQAAVFPYGTVAIKWLKVRMEGCLRAAPVVVGLCALAGVRRGTGQNASGGPHAHRAPLLGSSGTPIHPSPRHALARPRTNRIE